MLTVTDSAVSVFKSLIDTDQLQGTAVRLAPTSTPEGRVGITFHGVEGPMPGDAETEAKDLDIFVAPELTQVLDEAVLDAHPTDDGPELFLRQPEERSP